MADSTKTQSRSVREQKNPSGQPKGKTRPLKKKQEGLIEDFAKRMLPEETIELLRHSIDIHYDGAYWTDGEDRFIYVNDAGCKALGYERDELIGKTIADVNPRATPATMALVWDTLRTKGAYSSESVHRRKDGSEYPVEIVTTYVQFGGREYTCGFARDISGRRQVEVALEIRTEELRQRNEELTRLNERAERRMQRLVSMRTIDMAISGSFDVSVVLGIVLDQVTGQLGSHAADILLFNQNTQTFKFSAGRGFRNQGLEHSSYKFGADLAWRIIRERKRVEIPDLKVQPNLLQRSPDIFAENFQSYIGVPLVTKGQVRGVLEVFHRDALTPDREWYNYLEMLAGQAAIAVDNAALFEHMQNSNTELVMAYDSTLVGWAFTLELRGLEPKGHSHRVDIMTAQLAHALGLKDSDLVHIHRGALLHDIGKLGVPDSILLKPGPLSEEERGIMRKHPQAALDMLSPIAFLRPALDIPYYHHERWDGTGYPRGLRGENIPLPARIFAVVDVYDALTSDQPYRKAWSRAKAREYVHQQAGLEFDPEVVNIFLERNMDKE